MFSGGHEDGAMAYYHPGNVWFVRKDHWREVPAQLGRRYAVDGVPENWREECQAYLATSCGDGSTSSK